MTRMVPLSPPNRLPRQGLILLAALSLCWGINWPVMKIVLVEIPPLYFRGTCLLLSGLGLLLIARINGNSIVIPRAHWRHLLAITLINVVGWNVLAIYGVLLLSSGRAALLAYTMPIWSTLLSVPVLGEALTRQRLLALALGLAGIVVLMGGSLTSFFSTLPGFVAMILAAWAWALGIVLFKRFRIAMPTISLTGWTMLFGSFPVLAVAIPLETARLGTPGFWPMAGLFYNVFLSFMFGNWAWNRIVLMVPVAVSSLSSLVIPLIGVTSGMILLGEPLGWQEMLATALILGAVGTVSGNRMKRLREG